MFSFCCLFLICAIKFVPHETLLFFGHFGVLCFNNKAKGRIAKQSKPNFPKNEHFLPPDTHTYVCVLGGKKCSFFRKFGVLCLLETPVLRFALLPYYRRKAIERLLFFLTLTSRENMAH